VSKKLTITFRIQQNLNNNGVQDWTDAIQNFNDNQYLGGTAFDAKCDVFDLPPFSTALPEAILDSLLFEYEKGNKSVILGSTTSVMCAQRNFYGRQSVFYNPQQFRPSVYAQQLGADYLNSDFILIQPKHLNWQTTKDIRTRFGTNLFFKVDNDSKQVSGTVDSAENFEQWVGKIQDSTDEDQQVLDAEYGILTRSTPLFIAPVQELAEEWRFVVVGGRPIAASMYQPTPAASAPREVWEFAQRIARGWTPHPVCVMDIARTADNQLKVIEFNCFNNSGLYKCHIENVVQLLGYHLCNHVPQFFWPGA